jgi:hypothetical protein
VAVKRLQIFLQSVGIFSLVDFTWQPQEINDKNNSTFMRELMLNYTPPSSQLDLTPSHRLCTMAAVVP